MTDKIIKGDIVEVNFHNSQYTLTHKGEVIYIPVATGDSWIIKCLVTGDVHHISEGCSIVKRRNSND